MSFCAGMEYCWESLHPVKVVAHLLSKKQWLPKKMYIIHLVLTRLMSLVSSRLSTYKRSQKEIMWGVFSGGPFCKWSSLPGRALRVSEGCHASLQSITYGRSRRFVLFLFFFKDAPWFQKVSEVCQAFMSKEVTCSILLQWVWMCLGIPTLSPDKPFISFLDTKTNI